MHKTPSKPRRDERGTKLAEVNTRKAVHVSIQVQIKNVYGVQKIYPACDKAKLFAKLVGQTTLTSQDIRVIKDLGYTVEVVQEVFSL